jgi:hypothetical protein
MTLAVAMAVAEARMAVVRVTLVMLATAQVRMTAMNATTTVEMRALEVVIPEDPKELKETRRNPKKPEGTQRNPKKPKQTRRFGSSRGHPEVIT